MSNIGNYRHGGYGINRPEYNSWRAMKARCYDTKYWAYNRYGGRGIKVCDRWLGKNGFSNFLQDMGKKPTIKHSLDRIDNNLDYTFGNCKWSTQTEQVRNSTTVRIIEIDGVQKPLTEWAEIYQIKPATIWTRIYKLKMTPASAVTTAIGMASKKS